MQPLTPKQAAHKHFLDRYWSHVSQRGASGAQPEYMCAFVRSPSIEDLLTLRFTQPARPSLFVKQWRKIEAVSRGHGPVLIGDGTFWWQGLLNISITCKV